MIAGYATAGSSAQFATRNRRQFSPDAFRRLGRSGLTVSKIGFGTYRCHRNDDQHRQALRKAIAAGCNLIDTASNYGNGMAEELIGEVLAEAINGEIVRREEMVIVSKAGYIQGENLSRAKRRESRGRPFPEVVKFQEGLWHCLHPEFLYDQADQSRQRLQLETIDIYLLHNPEYFLMDALRRERPDPLAVFDEFYDRLKRAFHALEELSDAGTIRFYGISSNNLPGDPGRRDFVSLLRTWDAYLQMCEERRISPDEGHLAVLQFPFNWLETNALTLPNNFEGNRAFTLLQLAAELNLGVLTNRPLNAIRDRQLYRLARYSFDPEKDYLREIEKSTADLQTFENRVLADIRDWQLDRTIQSRTKLSEFFVITSKLKGLLKSLADEAQLDEMLARFFVPILQAGGQHFVQSLPPQYQGRGRADVQAMFNQFNRTTRLIREYLHFKNYRRVEYLEKRFDTVHPELSHLTFSQKALLVANSAPGVHSTLNGMRRPEYVEDSMEVLKHAAVDTPRIVTAAQEVR